jgi:hypothetical protein
MHPDRRNRLQNSGEASEYSSEMNESRKEILGRGGLEAPIDKTYTTQQHLPIRKGTEANASDRGENKENIAGEEVAVPFTYAKPSSRETLAQLRERHNALALYIKKMKEEIASHPVMIEREAARKAEEERVNVKEEENVDINMDDIDIDVILD